MTRQKQRTNASKADVPGYSLQRDSECVKIASKLVANARAVRGMWHTHVE